VNIHEVEDLLGRFSTGFSVPGASGAPTFSATWRAPDLVSESFNCFWMSPPIRMIPAFRHGASEVCVLGEENRTQGESRSHRYVLPPRGFWQ